MAQHRQVSFLGRVPSAAHRGRSVRRQRQLARRRRDQGRLPRLHVRGRHRHGIRTDEVLWTVLQTKDI